MYDYVHLRKWLLSRGYSENLVALKILPWTEQGILEAHCRAKRAFQCDYYDDEDDQGKINNHRKKKINVSFMDLIEMTNDSIERFTPEARFRLHNTVYYSTGDSPDEASPHGNDAPTINSASVVQQPTLHENQSKGEQSNPIILADDTVKISHWWYPTKRNFGIVMIILVASVALGFHVLLLNLLGTEHGLRGQLYNPRLRGGLSMATRGPSRIHPFGKDSHATFSNPKFGLRHS